MGTAPNGYQTPKTNWAAGQIPTASDFNRIEGNIQAIEEGQRTIDPAQAPSGNSGTMRQILDWLANRIKAILGTANWYDSPPTTLQATKNHIDAAAPHSGHETPAGAQAKADAAAGAVRAELDAHKTENASTSQKGHVQLSTSTTSTSTSLAATASAVKTVNDALTSHKAEAATETKLGHVKAKTRPDGTLIVPVNVIVYPAAGLPAEEGNEYTIAVGNDEFLHKVAESEPYGGAIRCLALDDTYIYIGGDTTQKVYKWRYTRPYPGRYLHLYRRRHNTKGI